MDHTGVVQPGTIACSLPQRSWAHVAVGQDVAVEKYDPQADGKSSHLNQLDLEASFYVHSFENLEAYSTDELAARFHRRFNRHVFTVGQEIAQEHHGQQVCLVVKSVRVVDSSSAMESSERTGVLIPETIVTYAPAPGSQIKLHGSTAKHAAPNAILQANFKFEDFGVGGLDEEFSQIFRRAFASRIFPATLVEKLGIQHVKGIILYGPPGTGKTLLARQIGKMLNAREPQIVNGPEILSKYVGASEENIRKLFAEAEREYKEKGDDSGLHIIIFDELDAVCRQRGTAAGSTGVGDSVVNQLLSKMDGVNQLNNILIIGMTNRLGMIDKALLRPGRLEVAVEISLPDEEGRAETVKIHTAHMRENEMIDSDVDVGELAALTKNFSGAEIAGLVKSATSFAFNRHVKVGTTAGIADDVESMRVNRDDFVHALQEVHPAFGVSEDDLQALMSNGIMAFAPHVDAVLRQGALRVAQVRQSSRTPLVTVLLHGPIGSGKTALAATIALRSDFPFIQIISPAHIVGKSEAAKVQHITEVFNDAYKSPLSVIVVDGLERLIDWVALGPRFQNSVFQTLAVFLTQRPPRERKLLVLTTTSNRSMLEHMELTETFSADIFVPAISSLTEVDYVVRAAALFPSAAEHTRAMALLQQSLVESRLRIGIKKLISEMEMARLDDEQPATTLLAALQRWS